MRFIASNPLRRPNNQRIDDIAIHFWHTSLYINSEALPKWGRNSVQWVQAVVHEFQALNFRPCAHADSRASRESGAPTYPSTVDTLSSIVLRSPICSYPQPLRLQWLGAIIQRKLTTHTQMQPPTFSLLAT